jgi:hypothetical protein
VVESTVPKIIAAPPAAGLTSGDNECWGGGLGLGLGLGSGFRDYGLGTVDGMADAEVEGSGPYHGSLVRTLARHPGVLTLVRVADDTSNRSQQFGKSHSARPDCVFGRLGAIQTR